MLSNWPLSMNEKYCINSSSGSIGSLKDEDESLFAGKWVQLDEQEIKLIIAKTAMHIDTPNRRNIFFCISSSLQGLWIFIISIV